GLALAPRARRRGPTDRRGPSPRGPGLGRRGLPLLPALLPPALRPARARRGPGGRATGPAPALACGVGPAGVQPPAAGRLHRRQSRALSRPDGRVRGDEPTLRA